jgi:rhodanese-related sulfurtransferase
MYEILSFLQHHWMLSSAFVIILILLFANEIRFRMSGVIVLSSQQVTQALNRDEAIVLDTRARNDYARGHILGAINLLEGELATETKRLEKYKQKQLIVIDANGQKAHGISLRLKKQGFNNIAMLKGGMQSWLADGLPVAK